MCVLDDSNVSEIQPGNLLVRNPTQISHCFYAYHLLAVVTARWLFQVCFLRWGQAGCVRLCVCQGWGDVPHSTVLEWDSVPWPTHGLAWHSNSSTPGKHITQPPLTTYFIPVNLSYMTTDMCPGHKTYIHIHVYILINVRYTIAPARVCRGRHQMVALSLYKPTTLERK